MTAMTRVMNDSQLATQNTSMTLKRTKKQQGKSKLKTVQPAHPIFKQYFQL